ncbi:MAG: polysaccharide deacetylase family protein [Chitinophagaceae bacterium]
MENITNGKFLISLDFELLWGVRDRITKNDKYSENIKGVHLVIPKLLNIFSKYNIKATFSVVGFLFFKNKTELLGNIPKKIPNYSNLKYSPYLGHFDSVGEDYLDDLVHFAPQLINEIKKHPEQEIGSHTFSHYYCLEDGQTINDFYADMEMAIEVAKKDNINITSLVFPRNQFNDQYLKVCRNLGIICYRGNEHSWLYKAKNGEQENKFRRALRLVDAYINISGHNCYNEKNIKGKFPIDLASSRFLRPFSNTLKILDRLRLNRILTGMTYAAKNNLIYHLWWHPHNFGINQSRNFAFLEKIMNHYADLNKKHNFQSITMSQLANKLMNER